MSMLARSMAVPQLKGERSPAETTHQLENSEEKKVNHVQAGFRLDTYMR